MYFKCSNVPFRCLHVPGWQGQHSPSLPALPQPWKGPAAPGTARLGPQSRGKAPPLAADYVASRAT